MESFAKVVWKLWRSWTGCDYLTVIRLAKVTFIRRAKVQYLCLQLHSLWMDLGHQFKQMACSPTVFFSFCHTNCHVRALFINGHRLGSNSHVHEWDVVVPCFLHQHGLDSLAWWVLQVKQAHPRPLTSDYSGQAQSCSFVNVLSLVNCPYT